MGHLADRWTSGLAQKVSRFSYQKFMGVGPIAYRKRSAKPRLAHQRTACQGIYCMGGLRMIEDGVHCVG